MAIESDFSRSAPMRIGLELMRVRDYEAHDTAEVISLIRRGLGAGPSGNRDERFWDWKHLDNPFGPSIALLSTTSSGQIVGLRTFMQWRFRAGDRLVRAVRAVDTVTHPDYRRHGVFSLLTREAVTRARNSSVDLIFNTPNNSVLPGYLKLGWRHISTVRPMVKVLNYPRFAVGLARHRAERRSAGANNPTEFFLAPPPSMAEFLTRPGPVETLLLGQQQRASQPLATDRTMEYLQWRYCRYPNATYFVVPKEKDGMLSGGAILRPNIRFGMKEIVLDELLLTETDEAMASSLINDVVKCLKADYIIAYFAQGSWNRNVLRRYGFHQVPRYGMNFTVKTLSPDLGIDPTVMANWSLSLGDLEVF